MAKFPQLMDLKRDIGGKISTVDGIEKRYWCTFWDFAKVMLTGVILFEVYCNKMLNETLNDKSLLSPPHSPDDFQDALLGLAGMLPLLEHGEHLLLAVDADGRQDRVELEESMKIVVGYMVARWL